LADLQRTVYLHSGHPSAEGRAQDRVSSLVKRSANCATQPIGERRGKGMGMEGKVGDTPRLPLVV